MNRQSPHCVSVVIPAYNSAASIGRAVDSVLAQTHRDIEIIVVDDGSTDDLAAAVARYGEQVLVVRQPNSGAASARNRGVAEAQSEFLAFLDADDCWHPKKLEYQIEAFRRWPSVALCFTGCRHFGVEAAPPCSSFAPPVDEVICRGPAFEALFETPTLGTPAVMMRRSVFEEVGGFRGDLTSAEDIDLWLRASYGRETARIAYPLAYIFATPGSLSARQGAMAFRNNLRVIEEFCAANPTFAKGSKHSVRRATAKVYETWASGELVAGNSAMAQELALQSIRHSPSTRASYLYVKARFRRIVPSIRGSN